MSKPEDLSIFARNTTHTQNTWLSGNSNIPAAISPDQLSRTISNFMNPSPLTALTSSAGATIALPRSVNKVDLIIHNAGIVSRANNDVPIGMLVCLRQGTTVVQSGYNASGEIDGYLTGSVTNGCPINLTMLSHRVVGMATITRLTSNTWSLTALAHTIGTGYRITGSGIITMTGSLTGVGLYPMFNGSGTSTMNSNARIYASYI